MAFSSAGPDVSNRLAKLSSNFASAAPFERFAADLTMRAPSSDSLRKFSNPPSTFLMISSCQDKKSSPHAWITASQ